MTIANRDQAEHWNNGEQVGHWITQHAQYDRMLAPFVDMILDEAELESGDRLLDVGCGCGATTLAAARVVAPSVAVGADLSGPMLERARADADAAALSNITFLQADAQVHPFDDDAFDAVISRFGIMFFADPVAAFANLRRATRPEGRLTFVCWQPLAANPWFLVPGAALAEHLPPPEPAAPGAPGMFAFADPERPRRVLDDAGWHDITITPKRTPVLVGGGGSVDDAVEFLRNGSMGRAALAGAEPAAAERAMAAVHDALAAHMVADGVQLDAAVWLIRADA